MSILLGLEGVWMFGVKVYLKALKNRLLVMESPRITLIGVV